MYYKSVEDLRDEASGLYKIIVLVGKTRSGKDTIANLLYEMYRVEPIVSYTTRPKRDNEIDGREHHFITQDEMDSIKQNYTMLAYTKNNKTGYEYCACTKGLIPDKWYSYILNPEGLYYLLAHSWDKVFLHIVYVDCPEIVLVQRCKERNDSNEVFFKRLESEREEFDYFKENYKKLICRCVNTFMINKDQMPVLATNILDWANNMYSNFYNLFVATGYPIHYNIGDKVYVKGLNHKSDIVTETRVKDVIVSYKQFLEAYYILEDFQDTVVKAEQLSTKLTKEERRKMKRYKRKQLFRKIFKLED